MDASWNDAAVIVVVGISDPSPMMADSISRTMGEMARVEAQLGRDHRGHLHVCLEGSISPGRIRFQCPCRYCHIIILNHVHE